MTPLLSIGFLLLLAFTIMGSLHLLGVDIEPEREKRTYIFETEDGDRYNPFSETLGADGETDDRCWNCGSENGPDFSYCGSCAARLPPKQQD